MILNYAMKFLAPVRSRTRVVLDVISPLQFGSNVRNYAARKGKRMKELMKQKARAAEVKDEFVPFNLRHDKDKKILQKFSKLGKAVKDDPIDNVYLMKFYKYRKYTVAEALEMHKESHHPAIYDDSSALVNAFLELDMTIYKKANKCLDGFTSLLYYPHNIQHAAPYKVLAICEKHEDQMAAKEAGAAIVADIEYVDQLKSGEVPHDNFDFCITTPDLVKRLVPIRGILNKRFPSQQKGSASFEIRKTVDKYVNSIEYKVKSHKLEPAFGWLEMPVGKLDMSSDQVEQNLDTLLKDICNHKSPSIGPPIFRYVFLTCPPTKEKFMIPHEKYLPEKYLELSDDEDEAVN